MTAELLMEFSEAWNQRDAAVLMPYMAENCIYQVSFGPELEGSNHVGRDAVFEGFSKFFERFPDGEFSDAEVWVLTGDRGATVWTFSWTGEDGKKVSQRGCDLFEFEGDKIKRKNAFRKLRQP
jgi:ketosteroid isomerase-like protein